jgi:integrase
LTSEKLKQLREQKIDKLPDFDLSNNPKNYSSVKDEFRFAYYTGIRYSNIKILRPEHIKSGEIPKRMAKTRKIEIVPIIPNAQAILDKYSAIRGNPYRFRVFSNTTVSRFVKKIGGKVEIDSTIAITRNKARKHTKYLNINLVTIHLCNRQLSPHDKNEADF